MTTPSLPVDPSEVPPPPRPVPPQPAPVAAPRPAPPVPVPPVPPQAPPPTGPRKWVLRGLAVLTAFGVFGAVGSYYVPKLLDQLGEAIDPPPAPVAATVVHQYAESPNFVLPATADQGSVPDRALAAIDKSAFADWAIAQGGVIADEDQVRFVLRGRDATLVHLESIRVKVLKRSRPQPGWFNAWDGCGAAVVPEHLRVSADGGAVHGQWVNDAGPAEAPAFTVSASDEEVIDVTVVSTEDAIEWVLEVDYSSAAGDGVLTVDDGGKPFVLTTVGSAQAWLYPEPDGGSLVRQPDRDPGAATAARPPC
ncbi:hypothetical protein Cs7R123_54060 [Catellatospora sp. TT07R-123]|uniref:hypothetical protein n=1 Tax=Catellatospora sp. TT07R-123 TaxID=2733863 RepID=UPI001B04142F|nr:hypothetical protein [Catellatospora sp. TT07R-123]GHJ48064.1 hypothetical protein Cs7R123_54060 [Catellatospora sp. TT07R-123]